MNIGEISAIHEHSRWRMSTYWILSPNHVCFPKRIQHQGLNIHIKFDKGKSFSAVPSEQYHTNPSTSAKFNKFNILERVYDFRTNQDGGS